MREILWNFIYGKLLLIFKAIISQDIEQFGLELGTEVKNMTGEAEFSSILMTYEMLKEEFLQNRITKTQLVETGFP